METVEEAAGALELTDSEGKINETDGVSLLERYCHPSSGLQENVYNAISSNVSVKTTDPLDCSMNMMFGFNVSINKTRVEKMSPTMRERSKASIELPERDYNCPKKPEILLNEFENAQNSSKTHKKETEVTELSQTIKNLESEKKRMVTKEDEDICQARRKEKGQVRKKEAAPIKSFAKRQPNMTKALEEPDMLQSLNKENSEITIVPFSNNKSDVSQLSISYYDNNEEEFIPFKIEGSLRSFTGSLHDITTDCPKNPSTLVRQRSYTVLKPSPLLIQHVQLQARNTGVDLNLISMSESLSNLPQTQKKKRRRSWDLESAKTQWSTMALDLKKNIKPVVNINSNAKTSAKPITSPYLANSPDRYKKQMPRYTKAPKSDPIQRSKFGLNKNNATEKSSSKNNQPAPAANRNGGSIGQTKESPKVTKNSISTADDPATKVRELYEKIQKQQIDQMANLVEKQKHEQMLLQQVFEEQNNMLFKQLKNICPEPTVEIKQAWCEKDHSAQRGPVSLSQLINHPPIESSPQTAATKMLIPQSPVSGSPRSVLTSPSSYSRADTSKRNSITGNSKHNHNVKPRNGAVTGTNASRKLNYDSVQSSDYEPMLTDRTNDTMADLNVTFSTDHSDGSPPSKNSNMQQKMIYSNDKHTDNAIRSLEDSIHKTMHAVTALTKQHAIMVPNPREVKQLIAL